MTVANATLGGRIYEFVLTAEVALDTAGVDGSAVVSLRVDASGRFRGTVSNMAFESAGIGIRAAGADWHLTDGGQPGPLPDWLEPGRFALPDVDAGGFRLIGLKRDFLFVKNSYVVEAAGGFSLPNLGGKGCSGLAVSVRFRIVEWRSSQPRPRSWRRR